jgi:hypothetical protein
MKEAVILSYKATSKSARYLTQHLEGRMITQRETIQPDECIINWGGGMFPSRDWNPEWLNKPNKIENAVEKIKAFQLFAGADVPHPAWTFHISVARQWLESGYTVLARQTSTGMMGKGISLLNTPRQPIPAAEFYSKHVQHTLEYRVHVFRGMVINLGMKIQLRPNANMMVRNADERDWDFTHVVDAPFAVQQAGVAAVQALGLDFGAADVGFRRSDGKAYVFEVNSAPGVGHNTITRYAHVFQRYLRTL